MKLHYGIDMVIKGWQYSEIFETSPYSLFSPQKLGKNGIKYYTYRQIYQFWEFAN